MDFSGAIPGKNAADTTGKDAKTSEDAATELTDHGTATTTR